MIATAAREILQICFYRFGRIEMDRTNGRWDEMGVYGPEISWLRWCCQGAVCEPTGRRGSPGGLPTTSHCSKPPAAHRAPTPLPNVQRLRGIDAHRPTPLNHPPLQLQLRDLKAHRYISNSRAAVEICTHGRQWLQSSLCLGSQLQKPDEGLLRAGDSGQ